MHPKEGEFYTAVIIAACVLGFIILYFIITMIKHQRTNVALYKAKIRAEISTLENERSRIASDLHDELGPILSAVRMQINHLDSENESDQKIVAYANKHIDDIIQKIRSISYNLMPNTLVRKGLFKAVDEYIGKLSEIHQELRIRLTYEDAPVPEREKDINIYRIIQEIIHNTIKHAQATQLSIEFRKSGNNLLLVTADNGIGFDYDGKMKDAAGLGLITLQSRAEILNARFVFKSEPGKGTNYFFEIPLNTAS